MDRFEEALELGGIARYTDYRELILSGRVDAVLVCTPTVSHMEICVFAAEHGVHVFCGKPAAMNWEEAKRMEAAANFSLSTITVCPLTANVVSLSCKTKYLPMLCSAKGVFFCINQTFQLAFRTVKRKVFNSVSARICNLVLFSQTEPPTHSAVILISPDIL